MTAGRGDPAPGLNRVGGVVVLTGPALRTCLQAALIAVKHHHLTGLPRGPYEHLARELHAALSAPGHTDVPPAPVRHPEPVQHPSVPIDQAAARLGLSRRQARRLAPRLGGRLVGGRWLLDDAALQEHLDANGAP